ncbi:MAG: ribbon-helix-helix domain-containing protein [Kiritimatiellia bacterium]|jgi:hypothetical protein|nr:ribbon-helix-helix domain-containing protein [Kiritimatiellia bacterium]MDP6811417.1 ribbon-helix-helix domain-containing protein [Kiritimatiellia bacterium]MDP7023347.1 ribbon-helix-helix domain-containing protein [Kiritimatiellia bacterium]
MSKRLQVVLDDAELEKIQQIAKARHQTVSEWVRQVLRAAEASYPTVDADRKIQMVREATSHSYPTADVDQMLREIEQGQSWNGAS